MIPQSFWVLATLINVVSSAIGEQAVITEEPCQKEDNGGHLASHCGARPLADSSVLLQVGVAHPVIQKSKFKGSSIAHTPKVPTRNVSMVPQLKALHNGNLEGYPFPWFDASLPKNVRDMVTMLQHVSGSRLRRFRWKAVIIGLIILVVLLIKLRLLSGYVQARLVRLGLEAIDGVNVKAESVNFGPFTGTVQVNGLVVGNPEGFDAPYLLKAGEVFFDLDTWTFCRSRFSHVVIEKLRFQKVHFIVEASSKGTNLQALAAQLHANSVECEMPDVTMKEDGEDVTVELQSVKIHEVTVELIGDVLGMHPHINVEIAEDALEDCCKDCFDPDSGQPVDKPKLIDVVTALLKSVLKTIHSDIFESHNIFRR